MRDAYSEKEFEMNNKRKVVFKVTPEIDIHTIEATTYQMRNFYRQFADGFFSVLDVMNYIQHQQIVRMAKKGYHLLDVCCGRGLLLPMLRYERKELGSYTGVDIEPRNAKFKAQRVTDGKEIPGDYYPFEVNFVESNVSEMASHLHRKFDFIVYTSSIEHMHKDAGRQSLFECRKVSYPGTRLVITCPNTPENQDGYDTQYKAHVYEWKRSELLFELESAGFKVLDEYGILIDKKTLYEQGEKIGIMPTIKVIEKHIPSEWLLPVFAPLFPEQSKEIAIIAEAI